MIFQSFGAHLVASAPLSKFWAKKWGKASLTSTTDDKPKPTEDQKTFFKNFRPNKNFTKSIYILFQFSESKISMGGSLIQEIFRQINF